VCDATHPRARRRAHLTPSNGGSCATRDSRSRGTLSFAQHIKGLFRARDRGAMRFAFNHWSAAEPRLLFPLAAGPAAPAPIADGRTFARGEEPQIGFTGVTAHFFRTIGIALLKGSLV
jgi:hypothetical protein